MRALTEEETKTVFTKLANYTGRSLTSLLTPETDSVGKTTDQPVFRVQNNRVYYVKKSIANLGHSALSTSYIGHAAQ